MNRLAIGGTWKKVLEEVKSTYNTLHQGARVQLLKIMTSQREVKSLFIIFYVLLIYCLKNLVNNYYFRDSRLCHVLVLFYRVRELRNIFSELQVA